MQSFSYEGDEVIGARSTLVQRKLMSSVSVWKISISYLISVALRRVQRKPRIWCWEKVVSLKPSIAVSFLPGHDGIADICGDANRNCAHKRVEEDLSISVVVHHYFFTVRHAVIHQGILFQIDPILFYEVQKLRDRFTMHSKCHPMEIGNCYGNQYAQVADGFRRIVSVHDQTSSWAEYLKRETNRLNVPN